MLDATSIAFPRSLLSRGFTLKSKTMSSTTRSIRERELRTFCIVPHCSRSAAFCQSFKPFVLASNQASIFLPRSEFLRDIARLIDKVEHHFVLDRFAKLVGVNVPAEHFETGLLVLLEQRRAGEANEHSARQQCLHRLVQLAALRAMAFIHEDEQLTDCWTRLLLQFLDEGVEVIDAFLPNLWTSEQSRRGLACPSCAIRSCPLLVR